MESPREEVHQTALYGLFGSLGSVFQDREGLLAWQWWVVKRVHWISLARFFQPPEAMARVLAEPSRQCRSIPEIQFTHASSVSKEFLLL